MLSVQHKFFKRKKASTEREALLFYSKPVVYFNFSKSEAIGSESAAAPSLLFFVP